MASKSTGKEQRSLKDTRNTSDRRASAKCKTPLKDIISGFDRKKSRSSMKKIKVVPPNCFYFLSIVRFWYCVYCCVIFCWKDVIQDNSSALYGNMIIWLLQKLLRSHGKKKSTLSRSPSLSQVKLALNGFEERMKSCDSKGYPQFISALLVHIHDEFLMPDFF